MKIKCTKIKYFLEDQEDASKAKSLPKSMVVQIDDSYVKVIMDICSHESLEEISGGMDIMEEALEDAIEEKTGQSVLSFDWVMA